MHVLINPSLRYILFLRIVQFVRYSSNLGWPDICRCDNGAAALECNYYVDSTAMTLFIAHELITCWAGQYSANAYARELAAAS